ncbi:copper resistance CopC family protein [Planococcus halocryophilus]|uniref:CopC domain-containing protein n=2 Tax=Planococcus halocryophilus TaxID=1215089 RepID=A0A1C7DU21_9BACL|nr:copper resistance CopC family protein [Planococcus halocryophilus]ANU14907.1 hypothetical protein BBI08_14055 [Planococcus halocryophilus]
MKKIMVLLVLAIFALPVVGQAHTTLSSSTPAEGSVVAETLEEVVLTFGTVIEQGSTMTLEREGITYDFEEITFSSEVMTGAIKEELPNGSYTIQWKIIGVDGHPIEGEVPFELAVEVAEEVQVVEDSEVKTEGEPVVEKASATEEQSAQATETTEEDGGNMLITILLILAVMVIGFIVFRLLKKK